MELLHDNQTTVVAKLPWPTPQDYNESIQNPSYAFSDPDLKASEPELNIIGLPKPASGNFASVYRLYSEHGDWAVRCFMQPLADQEMRYEALSSRFSRVNAPFLTDFTFIRQGIRVHANWYPIIKMEWISGLSLLHYIERNLDNSQKLEALAASFREVVLSLRAHGIAHGDLQHGNILVQDDGTIRLVDYDGCFVNELSGLKANELGHRNYQHPARTAENFSADLDNFAAWLIWSSITNLSKDPNLWHKLYAGDECLLLRNKDLTKSEYSRAFHLLETHYEQTVRLNARFLRSLLYLPIDELPSLEQDPQTVETLPPISAVVQLQEKEPHDVHPATTNSRCDGRANSVLSSVSKGLRHEQKLLYTALVGSVVGSLVMCSYSVVSVLNSAHPAKRITYLHTSTDTEHSQSNLLSVIPDTQTRADRFIDFMRYLGQAEKLMRRQDFVHAAYLLQQALRCDIPVPADRALVLYKLGQCQSNLSSADNGQEAFEEARDQYRTIGDDVHKDWCSYELVKAYYKNGQYNEAVQSFCSILNSVNTIPQRKAAAVTIASDSALKEFARSEDDTSLKKLWESLQEADEKDHTMGGSLSLQDQFIDTLAAFVASNESMSSTKVVKLLELECDFIAGNEHFQTASQVARGKLNSLRGTLEKPVTGLRLPRPGASADEATNF